MAPKQTWSEEEIRVLLLLYTQWNVFKQRKLVHQVFTTIFPNWKGTQHALHREFNGRFGDGSSPLWYDIDRPNKERQEPYTTEELATNMALFEKITSSVDEATRKELSQFAVRNWPHYLDGDSWRQATADRMRREREEREKKADGGGGDAGSSKSHTGEKEVEKVKEKQPKQQSKEKSSEEDQQTEPNTKAPEKPSKGKKKATFGSMGSAEWQQRHIEQRDREQARKEKQAKLQEMKSGRNLRSRRDKVDEFAATMAQDNVEDDEEMEDDDGELFEKPAKPSNPLRTYGARSKADNKPFGKLKTPSKKPIEISSGDEEEEEEEIDEIPAKVPAITSRSNAEDASKPAPSLRNTRARVAAESKDGEYAKEMEDEKEDEQEQKPTKPPAATRPSRHQSLLSAHLAAVDPNEIRKPVKPDDEEDEQSEDEQDPAKPSAASRASSRQKVPSTPAATSPRRTRARAASIISESNDEKENNVEQTPAKPPAIKRASRFRRTKSTHVGATRQTRSTRQPPGSTHEKAKSDEEEIPPSEDDEELPDVPEESEDEE